MGGLSIHCVDTVHYLHNSGALLDREMHSLHQGCQHVRPTTRPNADVRQDPELLRFIDIECYCWSTVLADFTPMINSGMVFCDRHFGGINYPRVGFLLDLCIARHLLCTFKVNSKISRRTVRLKLGIYGWPAAKPDMCALSNMASLPGAYTERSNPPRKI